MEQEGTSDDLELLQRVRGGDADALDTLMGRYDRLVRYAVFRACKSECRRDGDFLDSVASETWSGFVESVRRRDSALPHSLKTYLLQIARNKCTDVLRRAGRGGGGGGLNDWARLEAPSEPMVEVLARAEQVEALRSCIAALTSEEQKVYRQVELILDGRWKQAGEALGVPESTLRTRWPNMVKKLKACLEKKSSVGSAPGRAKTDF